MKACITLAGRVLRLRQISLKSHSWCHRGVQVIKLSDAVQPLPRQATQYVHGAPECFLKIGDQCSHETADGKPRFTKGAYTLGKMVWGKVSSPPNACAYREQPKASLQHKSLRQIAGWDLLLFP